MKKEIIVSILNFPNQNQVKKNYLKIIKVLKKSSESKKKIREKFYKNASQKATSIEKGIYHFHFEKNNLFLIF